MKQRLSTAAWRYVFWRAQNDFSIGLLKRVLPGLLLILFFIHALFQVLPHTEEFKILSMATAVLATFIYDETYGEYVYRRYRKTYTPKYKVRLHPYVCAQMSKGADE